jgi:hypothetical protein
VGDLSQKGGKAEKTTQSRVGQSEDELPIQAGVSQQ